MWQRAEANAAARTGSPAAWRAARTSIPRRRPPRRHRRGRAAPHARRARAPDPVHLRRRSIWIANAYFVPNWSEVEALLGAARDGVDVRILVPQRNDHPWVTLLTRRYYRRLLTTACASGNTSGEMMHAKTSVVDGRWVRVGSTDFNPLGMAINYELDAVIEDPALGAQAEAMFLADLEAIARDHVVTFSGSGIIVMSELNRDVAARVLDVQRRFDPRMAAGAAAARHDHRVIRRRPDLSRHNRRRADCRARTRRRGEARRSPCNSCRRCSSCKAPWS